MPRQNRTLRTLRGGGTSSYTFNPASHVMNNPVAWRSEAIEGGVRSMPSVSSHGLPMQRGGGYSFVGPNNLAGGMAANSSTHCQPLPVASLNTRVQGGGKRKTSKQNKNRNRNRSRKNRNKSNKNKRSNNKRN